MAHRAPAHAAEHARSGDRRRSRSRIPAAIFAEAALGFLGLGLPPPAASLGTLVSAGYTVIQRNVWNVVFPAAAVAVLMLCFTFVGDGLRDALDPATR